MGNVAKPSRSASRRPTASGIRVGSGRPVVSAERIAAILLRGRFLFALPAELVHDFGQRLAVDVLHGEIVDSALLAHGVHGHDVRMVELGGGLGLVTKTGNLPVVEHGREGQHL